MTCNFFCVFKLKSNSLHFSLIYHFAWKYEKTGWQPKAWSKSFWNSFFWQSPVFARLMRIIFYGNRVQQKLFSLRCCFLLLLLLFHIVVVVSCFCFYCLWLQSYCVVTSLCLKIKVGLSSMLNFKLFVIKNIILKFCLDFLNFCSHSHHFAHFLLL